MSEKIKLKLFVECDIWKILADAASLLVFRRVAHVALAAVAASEVDADAVFTEPRVHRALVDVDALKACNITHRMYIATRPAAATSHDVTERQTWLTRATHRLRQRSAYSDMTPRDALTVSFEAVVTNAAHASLCVDARRVQVTAAVSLHALVHIWVTVIAALSTFIV